MAQSKTSIISKASVLLGDSPVSGDDGSDAWEIGDIFYDDTYEELLRFREWTFARSNQYFPLLSMKSNLGYNYVYQVPNTVLVVSDLNTSGDYKIIKGQLHTDVKNPLVSCIIKPEEHTLPSDFVKALSFILAAEMAIPLIDDTTRADYYHKLSSIQVNKAIANDLAQEPQESFAYQSEIFTSRY